MARIIRFPSHGDSRGLLTVAEKDLPFTPVRAFWVTGADGQTRGNHGHKRTQLVVVAVTGTIDISVRSAQGGEFRLSSPNEGLHLLPEDWHVLQFGPSAVMLALASHGYDPDDYVLDPPEPTERTP